MKNLSLLMETIDQTIHRWWYWTLQTSVLLNENRVNVNEDVKMKIIYDPCVEYLLILTELHVSRIKMVSMKSTINFFSFDPCKAHVINELIKLGVKFPMYRMIGKISYPLNCDAVSGNNWSRDNISFLKFMAIMVDHELVSNSSFYQNVQIIIKLFAGCCWLFDSWLNELNWI